MNKLKQLSVGKQVLYTFETLCAILLIIGGLLFFSLRAIERGIEVQQARALNKLALIEDTAQHVGQVQADILRQILASDEAEIKQLDQSIMEIANTNSTEFADYQKFAVTEKEKQLYDSVMQARKAYWDQTQPVQVFARANQDAEATKFINSTQAPAYDKLVKAIHGLIAYVETDAKETSRATSHFISEIRIIADILIGVAIFILIGTAFTVAGVALQLKEDNNHLQTEIKERKRAEQELDWKTVFLEAQVNSSLDGILVVNQERRIILQNQRFIDLFKIPQQITYEITDDSRLRWVADMAKNPEQFVKKVLHLYEHPDEISRDEVELKDGTIVERYSSAVVGKDAKYYGRIWTFRDITERKRAQETLHQGGGMAKG